MTRIAFVRHGQTPWNATDRFQGSSDIALNDFGRAQAGRAAAWFLDNLPDAQWDFVRHSPLSRAEETAAIIADTLSVDKRIPLPSLTERDWAAAEGLTFEQCLELWPKMAEVDEFAAREYGANLKMVWDLVSRREPILDPPSSAVQDALRR